MAQHCKSTVEAPSPGATLAATPHERASGFRASLALLTILIAACSGPGNGMARQVETSDAEQVAPPEGPLAFRGAQGFGAVSAGGRGGRIIPVTTLDDSGPGSLRACIEADGPRVCVFRVSGVIRYTTAPPRIRNPFITIAGQTAPGGGITLAHAGGEAGATPLVVKQSHDVVIRHLRVRPDRIGNNRGGEDAITIEQSERVIIDHVSASWARDELINGHAQNDAITISNSIFAWAIPRHDKCALLGSDPTGRQTLSFIGNLCAHSGDRNPDINFMPGSCVEIFGNVFYNARSEFAEVWETYGGSPVALVGNSFIAGPDTSSSAVGIVRQTIGSTGEGSAYLRGNGFIGSFVHIDRSLDAIVRPQPPCPFSHSPRPAAEAYAAVLASAGAFPRDALDEQVVGEVAARRGSLASQPGTIPAIASGTPYPDADGDGMDDDWERANGTDPAMSDPWLDADGDGVANLEQFLDDLSDRLIRENGPTGGAQ
ncbi:pectate lyase family protein [Qipengyuania proteolytica]|uniref:pectate lyase family protein n=1 Tax=Qipengyuania proteolytica TaxID=2867239 RepID=UPI001FFCE851|nr:pectate lyase [Qipengyuania proteolytica]